MLMSFALLFGPVGLIVMTPVMVVTAAMIAVPIELWRRHRNKRVNELHFLAHSIQPVTQPVAA